MSIAEKLTTIAENQQAVYDAGKQAEYDAFWDVYQQKGISKGYNYNFSGNGWNDNTFRPKYDIKPTQCHNMFNSATIEDLAGVLAECGVVLDLSTVTGRCDNMFAYATKLLTVPELDLRNAVYANGVLNGMFQSCSKLHTIECIKLKEDGTTNWGSNVFLNCSALKNLRFSGAIGQNGLDLHWSTDLTRESLMSIINALQKKTSGTWTVTLGTTNLNKLDTNEKAIATDKGWTLA
jgi:hypothetical protein